MGGANPKHQLGSYYLCKRINIIVRQANQIFSVQEVNGRITTEMLLTDEK